VPQKELFNIIYNSYKTGKVTRDEVSSVYSILTKGNYSAWEREFKHLYEKFQRDQNIHSLLSSLSKLFHEFKIETRVVTEVRKLGPDVLTLVGCMFLVSPTFKEWNIISL
jgi:predicted cupin superfamily sugar epimerase